MESKKVTTTVSFDADVLAALNAYAKEKRLTRTTLLQQIVIDTLKRAKMWPPK